MEQTNTLTRNDKAEAQVHAISLICDLAVLADRYPQIGYDLAPALEDWANQIQDLDVDEFADQYTEYVKAAYADAPDNICIYLLQTQR